MTKLKKILLSGYLALGFLVLRLSYAFVFSGLGGNQVLISLAEIRLSGPFSHVLLFGDVSIDGILRNLETALPFALSILIFGIAASFVTAQKLRSVANHFPPLRNLINAVAIGLTSLPGLFLAAQQVLAARRLRGGFRSQLLVPILERSVEFATSIGLKLAMEPIGNRSASSIEVTDLEIPDCKLGPLSFEVPEGELLVLSGATGSGKSTLLEAIAGILTEYRNRQVAGKVSFDGNSSLSISEKAAFVSYIPQNPRELLWGFDVSELLAKVPDDLLARLGLIELLAKSTQHLSEGEAFKLLLAQSLIANPDILLLDEPYAPLDASSRLVLTNLLNELAARGVTIVVVEHEPNHTEGLIGRRLQLVEGDLLPGQYRPEAPGTLRSPALVGNEVVLSASLPDLSFGRLLIQAPSLTLSQSELVWLAGDNGSGKSSLLKRLAEGDGVLIHGEEPTRPQQLALVPENFDDFFVTDSLRAELLTADRVARVPGGFTETTLESILPGQELAGWMEVHPRDLSRGTRLALAIAMQLSHKPQLLMVDEPFRGLDLRARELMVESLRCVAETGCAVLFASHEKNWSETLATRKLAISNQQLLEVTEVSA
jgi:energy-coupling factor transport system ATP-binding protein